MDLARAPAAAALPRARGRERLTAIGRLWPWLPLVFAAAYLVVLAVTFKSLVQALYQSADLASAPYIGEVYPQAPPGAEVVLTNFPWFSTLWFEQATHWLPHHRQVWEVGPWLWSLVGVGLVAWSTARAVGRWAGAMVAVVLGCAGTGLILWQFAGSGHAPTFAHVGLLGAFLVLCATRPQGLIGRPAVHVAVCLLLAAVTAAAVASDQLLLLAGVAPFALAGLALRWLLVRPAGDRIALTAVAVAAAAVAGSRAILAIMHSQHVVGSHFDISLAPFDQLGHHVRLLGESLAFLFNGDFGGMKIDARGLLTLGCAAAVTGAAVAAVRLGRTWWRAEALPPRPAPRPPGGSEAARVAHVAFWLLASPLVALGFVLTSVPVDVFTSRFLVTLGYGLAALVPVVAVVRGPLARALVVLGACLVVGGSIRGLAARDLQANPNHFPNGSVSGPLLRWARAEGVKYGYAGYWDAAPLSWQMKAAVQLYPVRPCADGRLCPYGVHHISSWYVPRPGTRTILVTDSAPFESSVMSPPAGLGPAQRVVRIGQLTLYLYPYDIASRLGH